jgi:hypothetical protein
MRWQVQVCPTAYAHRGPNEIEWCIEAGQPAPDALQASQRWSAPAAGQALQVCTAVCSCGPGFLARAPVSVQQGVTARLQTCCLPYMRSTGRVALGVHVRQPRLRLRDSGSMVRPVSNAGMAGATYSCQ